MANAFSRSFIKPLKKQCKSFLLAHKVSLHLAQRSLLRYFALMKRFNFLYTQYGFMPDEAQQRGILSLKDDQPPPFVSKKTMVDQQKKINPTSFMGLTEDKAIFSIFCEKNNIPAPNLLGLFFSNSVGMNWIERKPLNSRDQWISFFLNNCPDEFVIKPSRGVYGDEIVFVDKNQTDFCAEKIYRKLQKSQYDSFVVQESLKNHARILSVSPKEGLQTVRVVTFIDKNSEVKIIYAFFKIIVGDNKIDNHKAGKLGNLLCQVALHDGTLQIPLLMTEEGLVEVPNHPDTGKSVAGTTLPFWEDAFRLAQEVAPHFLPLRSIGWDIALTPDGARIIEGNARWDPPSFGNFGEKELQIFGEMNIFQQP